MDLSFWVHLFLFGFLLNMTWEVWHSQLYTTCLLQPWVKNVRLLTLMSLKDAAFIVLFYTISFFLTERLPTISHMLAPHLLFVVIALTFSFLDEKVSVAKKRWEYASSMPRILGVGVTPLLEIAVTGVVAFMLVA